jgi:hypothetical protein
VAAAEYAEADTDRGTELKDPLAKPCAVYNNGLSSIRHRDFEHFVLLEKSIRQWERAYTGRQSRES